MNDLNSKQNVLYFFTAGFPFGKEETFIETEIKFLANNFDKILIISHDINNNNIRSIPKNVKVSRIRYNLNLFEKILAIFQVFNYLFWREIKVIKNHYKLKVTYGIFKTLIFSLFNSKRLAKHYYGLKSVNENSIFYSYWMNDSSIALSFLKKKYNLTCVTKMHRWDIYFEENKYNYLPMRTFIIDNQDLVYSISTDGISYFKNKLKLDVSKFRLARLGINKQLKSFVNSSKNKIIISCSKIIEVKRVDLIARAIEKTSITDLTWVHFGDGKLYNELINYCDLNLKAKIKCIFMGHVSNSQVMNYYKNNNPSLFINLSSSEGVPVSIMEAMSYGIPVIATNVGGNAEIVNNKNGYIIDPNTSADYISQIINGFFNLPQKELNDMRNNSFTTWENFYNAEKNYEDLCSSLRSFL